MAAPNFYAAVYAIIRDKDGKILFSQRKNSKFMDGKYQLPAGHMDDGETMVSAMKRELKEELDIEVEEWDMKIAHISHAAFYWYEYFNIYINISKYHGTPIINEPEKCGDIRYFDITTVDRAKFAGYDIDAIFLSEHNIPFSDVDIGEHQIEQELTH